MISRISYALTLMLALLLAGVALAQKASPAKPSVPKGWSFAFPMATRTPANSYLSKWSATLATRSNCLRSGRTAG